MEITNSIPKSRIMGRITKVSPEVITIPIISSMRIYDSYKKAEPEQKKNILFRDLTVLAATGLGIWGGVAGSKKLLQHTKLNNIKDEVLKMVSIPLGGIVSGVLAGEAAERLFPVKKITVKEKAKEIIDKKLNDEQKQDPEKIKAQAKFNNFKTAFKKTATLALTCLGILAGGSASKKIMGLKTFAQKQITKETKDLARFASFVAGGFIANTLGKSALDKILPTDGSKAGVSLKGVDLNSPEALKIVEKELNTIFKKTFGTLEGFDAGREIGFENRFKTGFYELVSGIVVPAAIVLPLATVVKNKVMAGKISTKFAKKMIENIPVNHIKQKLLNNPEVKKQITEKSIILPVTVASLYIGEAIGNWFNDRVMAKIMKKEILKQVDDIKTDIVKASLKGISENNESIKKEAVANMAKVKEIENVIKK